MKNLVVVTTLALALSALNAGPARAQGAPGSTGPKPDDEPTNVPLDGGASLLLAGGLSLGLHRLRQRKAR